MENSTSSSHRPLKSRVSWITIVLGLLALGTFVYIYSTRTQYSPFFGMGRNAMMETGPGALPSFGTDTAATMPSIYPNSDQGVSATDTREYSKVYYNATMRTRDAQGLTRRVEKVVRGHDGRVDQESSSRTYGSVGFAVPKSKYEAFRSELESLVGNRFITVDISSQNMLPQKVSIEEQQKKATNAVSSARAARGALVGTHASMVATLQERIAIDSRALSVLRAKTPTPDVQAEIQSMSADLASQTNQLANENTAYAAQLRNADANIQYALNWQKGLETQDQALLDTVETVTGRISIEWISMWDAVQLYFPGYWIPFILAVLTGLSYLIDRRRFGKAIVV